MHFPSIPLCVIHPPLSHGFLQLKFCPLRSTSCWLLAYYQQRFPRAAGLPHKTEFFNFRIHLSQASQFKVPLAIAAAAAGEGQRARGVRGVNIFVYKIDRKKEGSGSPNDLLLCREMNRFTICFWLMHRNS